VALDAREGKTVVGALITTDFLTPPDPQCEAFVAQIDAFGPIAAAVDALDKAWFEKHSDIAAGQTGRVADLWMGGVRPAYRKCGIITQLVRICIEQATKAGFEYAIAECTGAYSQHLVEAAGFTSVYELPYADFLWEGEAIFKNVPAPHAKWAIYEKRLN
jgi:GNAT superfamily N-acetyltransferase